MFEVRQALLPAKVGAASRLLFNVSMRLEGASTMADRSACFTKKGRARGARPGSDWTSLKTVAA
jgi:hypothetical protein